VFLKAVSHRLHRGTLVPIVAAVFAMLVAAPVLASSAGSGGASPAPGGLSASNASGVRAHEWWLADLSTQQAWRTSEGAGITVAVLSTGVSADQPDLAGDVITGPDYTASGRYAGGPYWGAVGTAVASVIAGHGHGNGNNSGIIGIAPRSKILSVRVTLEYNDPLNATTAITKRLTGAIADGIVYAVNHGAKVIDLPLDPSTFGLAGDAAAADGSAAERSAVRYALDKGVVLIAPAGDNGSMPGQASYPAAYPGVVAVGATDRAGQLASFSNRDSYVSLAAPGVDLTAATMLPSQSYGYVPGYAPISTTSVASAMVAGVAALVVSKYPQLPVSDVARALRASATADSQVNAARALSVAATLSPRAPTPPARTPTVTKQHRTVRATTQVAQKAPPRPNAGMLASAVLRDAVLGVCGLIVVVSAILLITRTRRLRAQGAGPGPGSSGHGSSGPGLHEQRRGRKAASSANGTGSPVTGQLPGSPLAGSPLAGSPLAGSPLAGSPLAGLPMSGASMAGGSLTVDPLAAGSLASGWPAATGSTGWQGAPGEVAHGPAKARRPSLEPAPKSMRSKQTEADTSSPPWAPAARPGGFDGPVPVTSPGWFPGDPAPSVRLPGRMPEALRNPEASRDPEALRTPEAPRTQEAPKIPESPRTPDGFEGPDLTAPFAGRDVFTQSSFGLSAAPVPADYSEPDGRSVPWVSGEPAVPVEETDQPDDPA